MTFCRVLICMIWMTDGKKIIFFTHDYIFCAFFPVPIRKKKYSGDDSHGATVRIVGTWRRQTRLRHVWCICVTTETECICVTGPQHKNSYHQQCYFCVRLKLNVLLQFHQLTDEGGVFWMTRSQGFRVDRYSICRVHDRSDGFFILYLIERDLGKLLQYK